MNSKETKISEALVSRGSLTDVQLNVILDYQKAVGGTLQEVIIKLGFLTEEQFQEAINEMDRVAVDSAMIDQAMTLKIPGKLLGGYGILPVKLPNGTALAAVQPLEPLVCEELWALLGKQLPVVYARAGTLEPALEGWLQQQQALQAMEPAPQRPENQKAGAEGQAEGVSADVVIPELTVADLCAILMANNLVSKETFIQYLEKKTKAALA